ncbi:metal ABC transporter permease [Bartonella sp. LJL80]
MIDHLWHVLMEPFVEFQFMRNAVFSSVLLAVGACPVGVFLTMRRMSLTGDAMSHAILPGVAVAFLFFGLELIPMTIGGLIAGALVAIGAGTVSRMTVQKEDASMAALYLMSLALGVLMISLRGSNIDLLHLLFGSVLAATQDGMILIASISLVTVVTLSLFWRALFADCIDSAFFQSVSRLGGPMHFVFIGLTVFNLVGGFQTLGTLLSVGMMMVPAITARFWCRRLSAMCFLAVAIGIFASFAGLLLSYHFALPSGPAIILSAGSLYIASALLSPRGMLAGLYYRSAFQHY